MKKTALLFLFSIGILATRAQITIARSDFGNIGDTMYFAVDTIVPSTITPGSAGANQTWSFTTGLTQDRYDTTLILPPSFDPNAPAGTTHILSSFQNVEYLKIDSSAIRIIFDIIDFGITGVELKTFVFPTTYQTTNSDSNGFTVKGLPGDFGMPSGIFDSVMVNVKIYANSHCDGWGTLTTPTGSYNTLRIKLSTREMADVYGKGTLTGGVWTNVGSEDQTRSTYQWFAQNGKTQMASAVVDSIGNITSFSYRVPFIPVSTGISKQAGSNLTMHVSPNPANESITISFEQKETNLTTIEIMDVTGKIIKTEKTLTSFGQNTLPVNVSDIRNGVYFVRISNGNGLATSRFIINR